MKRQRPRQLNSLFYKDINDYDISHPKHLGKGKKKGGQDWKQKQKQSFQTHQ